MWLTSSGERVLRGAEWQLFRMGVSTLWDSLESWDDDEEPGTTDVRSFDQLGRLERIALLAQVARGLHDEDCPCPDLTALNEATVAAVFAQIRYLIEVEVDAQSMGADDCFAERATRPRGLVLAAIREVKPEREDPLPDAGSDDLAEWFELVDYMLDRILDDRDYLVADVFLDMEPAHGRTMKARLGIPEDYYTAIPPAPTREELALMRADLGRICGRPGAWTTASS